MLHRLAIAVMLFCALALSAGMRPALAQDATPGAAACVAPELPPGTPTPRDEATPDAGSEEPSAELTEEASPAAEEQMPPAEPPVGTPITGPHGDAPAAALMNLFACVEAGNYLGAGALMSDAFIQDFLEVPTVYDVPATFEGVQPVDVRDIRNAQSYADGRVSIDVVFSGLFNGPGAVSSERWFFTDEDGQLLLDSVQFGIALPEGMLPGAVVVDVQMVDYAFALSTNTVPANTPVIFRATNTSASGDVHETVILGFADDVTAQALIAGEIDMEAEMTGFFGAIFQLPGQSGDLAFESLELGIYSLICFVETADGTPHHELGMVAQITVE